MEEVEMHGQVCIRIDGNEVSWKVRRDTDHPKWVSMKVDDTEDLKLKASIAYDQADQKGVSPKKVFEKRYT